MDLRLIVRLIETKGQQCIVELDVVYDSVCVRIPGSTNALLDRQDIEQSIHDLFCIGSAWSSGFHSVRSYGYWCERIGTRRRVRAALREAGIERCGRDLLSGKQPLSLDSPLTELLTT